MTETAMNLDRKKVAVAAMIAGGVLLVALFGWMLVSGKGDVPVGPSSANGRQAIEERETTAGIPEGNAAPTDMEADASAQKAVTTRTEAKQALSELDGEIDAAGSGTGE